MTVKGASSRLFVSADLVGSTHYKQAGPGWQKVFLSFYREFPQLVADENHRSKGERALEFVLWKAVGDELIFQVEVSSEEDVSHAVRIWVAAMSAYEKQVLSDASLALKGGAFIATFPGPDSESTIPRNPAIERSDESVVLLNDAALKGPRDNSHYLFDYFGPSIDTGFRVFALCSKRYFTLSVEVAWALAKAAHSADGRVENESTHQITDFVLHGTFALKGVWGGREYPVFAIDRDSSDAVNRAISAISNGAISPQQVIDVCHSCHESGNWPSRLYLPDSSDETLRTEPQDAMKSLRDLESDRIGSESLVGVDVAGDPLKGEPPLGEQIRARIALGNAEITKQFRSGLTRHIVIRNNDLEDGSDGPQAEK